MKNKKTISGIVLLIIVLAIGIGYAAITGSLTITGTATATADENNLDVVFTGVTSAVSDGVTPTVTANSKTATLDVTGLKTQGDSKSATFEIENQSDELKALVAVTAEEITNTTFFTVDAEVADSTALDPNGTTTVTVTVKLVKTPIETVTGTINVGLTATAVLGD